MSRLGFRDGERITLVGVNSSTGKYHYADCRYYVSTESVMSEAKAIELGNICGACCKEED